MNPDVLSLYGHFLQQVRGDHDSAENMYKLSLKSNPTHLDTLQYYSIFLEEVRGDLDEAERMYSIALESTRNGLLEEVPTPTLLQHHDLGQFHSSSAQYGVEISLSQEEMLSSQKRRRNPPPKIEIPQNASIVSSRDGGSLSARTVGTKKKNNQKMCLARESVRLKQSPKREQLREGLGQIVQRKLPGMKKMTICAYKARKLHWLYLYCERIHTCLQNNTQ